MNLVFDFGAVLFQWRPTEILRRHFPELTVNEASSLLLAKEIFSHPQWQAFDQGVVTSAEVILQIAERTSIDAGRVSDMVHEIPEHLLPIEGTLRLLEELQCARRSGRDLRLYYLSNMPEPFARVLERRHSFLEWFDAGIFSGDVKLIKPAPDIFTLLADRFGLQAECTVFVDDSLANVRTARNLGWTGIHFESPAQLRGALGPAIGLPLAVS